MYLKIHRLPGQGSVTAVCDRELIGRTLSEGELEICASEAFYGEKEADEEEVCTALSEADNINILGERSLACAIRCGLADRRDALLISGFPHLQIYRT